MPTQAIRVVDAAAKIPRWPNADGLVGYLGSLFHRSATGTFQLAHEPSSIIQVEPAGPVATLTAAFALVSATRKTVLMAPGAYVEPAAVVWPTIKGVRVLGAGSNHVSISAPTDASVITVTPGAQTSTWEGYLEGVTIDHSAGGAQYGIAFSNAGMGRKLLFGIKNCGFEPDAVTDQSIRVAHGDASNGIRIYISGDGSQTEIGGAMYFVVANYADRLHCENLWLIGSITLVGADQQRTRLLRCVIPEHSVRVAVIGNSGLQTVTLVDCFQWTDYADTVAEIFEKAEAANVTGSTAVVVTS